MRVELLWLLAEELRLKTEKRYCQGSWRDVPIAECYEPLVAVPADWCYPYYSKEMGLGEPIIWLRQGVMERLTLVRAELSQSNLQLVVYDGWRSVEVQRSLFWVYMVRFIAPQYPAASALQSLSDPVEIEAQFGLLDGGLQDQLKQAAVSYVSWPSSDYCRPSPHATGGAVDVWLWRNGQPVNLGVQFDEMTEMAGTFYHHRVSRHPFSGNDCRVCLDRYLLIVAMAEAGFSCYLPEIWHFNYGNQMHGQVEGTAARYSYIEPPGKLAA